MGLQNGNGLSLELRRLLDAHQKGNFSNKKAVINRPYVRKGKKGEEKKKLKGGEKENCGKEKWRSVNKERNPSLSNNTEKREKKGVCGERPRKLFEEKIGAKRDSGNKLENLLASARHGNRD